MVADSAAGDAEVRPLSVTLPRRSANAVAAATTINKPAASTAGLALLPPAAVLPKAAAVDAPSVGSALGAGGAERAGEAADMPAACITWPMR